jgi:hypothetical protein
MTSTPTLPPTLPEARARIVAVEAEHDRLCALVSQLEARVQALEVRLGQNSTNSSRIRAHPREMLCNAVLRRAPDGSPTILVDNGRIFADMCGAAC